MLDIDIKRKVYADRGGRAHVALEGLRLKLHGGEFVCLVGPSGCGKSTLLSLIGGLDEDYEGQIGFAGPHAPKIGLMFQEARLMPWLTVIENVLLVAGADPSARRRSTRLLTEMELGDVLDAYPGRLSGGMRRRVALARAFVVAPPLLLMDEPFVSLDAPTAERLRGMLVSLWQRCDATVLFVTHDIREAVTMADRICFLSAAPGRLLREVRVDLPRPRSSSDDAVRRLADQLLAQHPGLLTGRDESGAQEYEVRHG